MEITVISFLEENSIDGLITWLIECEEGKGRQHCARASAVWSSSCPTDHRKAVNISPLWVLHHTSKRNRPAAMQTFHISLNSTWRRCCFSLPWAIASFHPVSLGLKSNLMSYNLISWTDAIYMPAYKPIKNSVLFGYKTKPWRCFYSTSCTCTVHPEVTSTSSFSTGAATACFTHSRRTRQEIAIEKQLNVFSSYCSSLRLVH